MIDIPNLEEVRVQYKDPRSGEMICFPLLQKKLIENVAPILANLIVVNSNSSLSPGLLFSEMEFGENETTINIPDNSCNDTEIFIDTHSVKEIEYLVIGENSFCNVASFVIDHLDRLKSIEIGLRSFTLFSGSLDNRFFTVSNCAMLESIILHPLSFTDYGKSFTLSNLPSLKYLQIGKVGCYSSNFLSLSFCLEGIAFLAFLSRLA